MLKWVELFHFVLLKKCSFLFVVKGIMDLVLCTFFFFHWQIKCCSSNHLMHFVWQKPLWKMLRWRTVTWSFCTWNRLLVLIEKCTFKALKLLEAFSLTDTGDVGDELVLRAVVLFRFGERLWGGKGRFLSFGVPSLGVELLGGEGDSHQNSPPSPLSKYILSRSWRLDGGLLRNRCIYLLKMRWISSWLKL